MNILHKNTKEEDYYVCPRCEENSFEHPSRVPCPRGSCEARIEGTITTLVVVNDVVSEEQKKWNEDNHR